jgi:hypothetical protein
MNPPALGIGLPGLIPRKAGGSKVTMTPLLGDTHENRFPL